MTTLNDAPLGYMPIPTAEQLAEALAKVRCFHDLSAELIAPELLANLLTAMSALADQPKVKPKRTVNYVCPVCAASLERQE